VSSICMALRGAATPISPPLLAPGEYTITSVVGVYPSQGLTTKHPGITLQPRTQVTVLEVLISEQDDRIYGRICEPKGFISLCGMAGKKRWAVPCSPSESSLELSTPARGAAVQEWRIFLVDTPESKAAYSQVRARMLDFVKKLSAGKQHPGFIVGAPSMEQHFCAGPSCRAVVTTLASGTTAMVVDNLQGVFGNGAETWEEVGGAGISSYSSLPWVALRTTKSRCDQMEQLCKRPGTIGHLDTLRALEMAEVEVCSTSICDSASGVMQPLKYSTAFTIAVQGSPAAISHAVGEFRLEDLAPHCLLNVEGSALKPLYSLNVSYPRFLHIAAVSSPLPAKGRRSSTEAYIRSSSIGRRQLLNTSAQEEISLDQAQTILRDLQVFRQRMSESQPDEKNLTRSRDFDQTSSLGSALVGSTTEGTSSRRSVSARSSASRASIRGLLGSRGNAPVDLTDETFAVVLFNFHQMQQRLKAGGELPPTTVLRCGSANEYKLEAHQESYSAAPLEISVETASTCYSAAPELQDVPSFVALPGRLRGLPNSHAIYPAGQPEHSAEKKRDIGDMLHPQVKQFDISDSPETHPAMPPSSPDCLTLSTDDGNASLVLENDLLRTRVECLESEGRSARDEMLRLHQLLLGAQQRGEESMSMMRSEVQEERRAMEVWRAEAEAAKKKATMQPAAVQVVKEEKKLDNSAAEQLAVLRAELEVARDAYLDCRTEKVEREQLALQRVRSELMEQAKVVEAERDMNCRKLHNLETQSEIAFVTAQRQVSELDACLRQLRTECVRLTDEADALRQRNSDMARQNLRQGHFPPARSSPLSPLGSAGKCAYSPSLVLGSGYASPFSKKGSYPGTAASPLQRLSLTPPRSPTPTTPSPSNMSMYTSPLPRYCASSSVPLVAGSSQRAPPSQSFAMDAGELEV